MENAINWHDSHIVTKTRSIYTEKELHIPGLSTLAHHTMTNAVPSLNWHYHENAFEFTMAAKGSITFSTRSASYPFSGGDVFVSFPNEVHGTNSTPITMGEIYWFQLKVCDESRFLFLTRDASRQMISQLKAIPRHLISTKASETLPLLVKAFTLAENHGDPQLIATYIQLFLHLIIADSKKSETALTPDIDEALAYIKAHLKERLSLEELAAHINLSCSQFKQKFKRQVGLTPRYFINQQKIEYSKKLLLSGKSVTEVAVDLSFSSSSYFAMVFRKFEMYAPEEFVRKVHNRNPDHPA